MIGGSTTEVQSLGRSRTLDELVIYELMLDDFTAQYRGGRAPVDAVLDRLDILADLGINTIEFMPWTAWPGDKFNWGYQFYLFFAVENRYIDDPTQPLDRLVRLQRLINAIHDRGMGVIMDGVFNHVDVGHSPDGGFPYHWLYEDPEDSPFTGEYSRGGYFADLDYSNECTSQFVADVCRFWLDRYGVDGIRFDYTLGFYKPEEPSRGIFALIRDVRAHLQDGGRGDVPLILEHLTDNRYQAVNDTNVICATACWYDRFLFDVPDASRDGVARTSLMRVLDTGRDFLPGKGPVVYIENHDHSTAAERIGGRAHWYRLQPALIALMTSPGAVMLHNGQEYGVVEWLPEDGPGRVQPRPIEWRLAEDGVGQALFGLHRRLAAARRDHPALRSRNFYPGGYDERDDRFNADGYGVDVVRGLSIYHRWGPTDDGRTERVIVVLNFSATDQVVDVPFSVDGTWSELLEGWSVNVTGWRLFAHRVPSHWGRMFVNRS